MKKRIAIIGGGLAGCLTALALAQRGIHSEIFEKNERELFEASYFNEGKVHLGFLYAHDSSGKTNALMAAGAATFRTIIYELTGFDTTGALSTPFLYAVHRDSLVSPDHFRENLSRCSANFSKSLDLEHTSGGYVNGQKNVRHNLLDKSEWNEDLDSRVFSAVFETDEVGVDPRILGPAVAGAVRDNGRITLHLNKRVRKVIQSSHDRFSLVGSDSGLLGGAAYDVVVNCSWSDLLRIDSELGISPPFDWSYRFKLANRVIQPVSSEDLRSVTVVLGAFGDIVNYGQEGIFLSWYPSGRLLMTDEIDLPDWNSESFRALRETAYLEAKSTWESISSKLSNLNLGLSEVDSRGGMILASGRLDVDNPGSPLHSRFQVGLKSRGSYISVNTGKFTLAPLMAIRAANRVQAVN